MTQSSDDDERRLKRREKNRVAAQRSRKRQTQRADELHEVGSHIMFEFEHDIPKPRFNTMAWYGHPLPLCSNQQINCAEVCSLWRRCHLFTLRKSTKHVIWTRESKRLHTPIGLVMIKFKIRIEEACLTSPWKDKSSHTNGLGLTTNHPNLLKWLHS